MKSSLITLAIVFLIPSIAAADDKNGCLSPLSKNLVLEMEDSTIALPKKDPRTWVGSFPIKVKIKNLHKMDSFNFIADGCPVKTIFGILGFQAKMQMHDCGKPFGNHKTLRPDESIEIPIRFDFKNIEQAKIGKYNVQIYMQMDGSTSRPGGKICSDKRTLTFN